MSTAVISQKFDLGEVIVTREALQALDAAEQTPEEFLSRHQRGDWGNLSSAECEENDLALVNSSYLRSVYKTIGGTKLWVLTSSDRSTTTVLMAP
jgi:hypothetical protein